MSFEPVHTTTPTAVPTTAPLEVTEDDLSDQDQENHKNRPLKTRRALWQLPSASTVRATSLWIHRYTGLFMAVFLVLTGVTGSLLAFHEPLDDWLNRDYLTVSVSAETAQPKDITALHQAVQTAFPEHKFSRLPLTQQDADRAVVFSVDRVRGGNANNTNNEASSAQMSKRPVSAPFQLVYVNPYTAQVIATRDRDAWQWRNAMYKVFWFHRNLLLDDLGKWLLGIVALVWTLNCFLGVYLTWPRPLAKKANKGSSNAQLATNRQRARKSALTRWRSAWRIRRTRNVFKLSFDAHQAFSLWLWGMMFVLAWSSVGFNLPQVYRPVMATLFLNPSGERTNSANANPSERPQQRQGQERREGQGQEHKEGQGTRQHPEKESTRPTISLTPEYIALAKAIALAAAQDKGVQIERFTSYQVTPEAHSINFVTDKDVGRGSRIEFTPDYLTNRLMQVNVPSDRLIRQNSLISTSEHGNSGKNSDIKTEWGFERSLERTVSAWLVALHRGQVGGLAYQIFLAIMGLVVVLVSVTGVYLWWRGRLARRRAKIARNPVHKKATVSS